MDNLVKKSALVALTCLPWPWCVYLSAQPTPGSISGNISCADGNAPARGADVELVPIGQLSSGEAATASAHSGLKTTTDFFGTYDLASVEPGVYILNAVMDGYSDDFALVRYALDRYSAEDRKKLLAPFSQVTIKPGSEARKDLVLHRGAAISGRISVDLGGTPGKIGVTADLVSSSLLGDSQSGAAANPISYSRNGIADDRGYYRIAGLPSGKYRLNITVSESYFEGQVRGDEKAVLVVLAPRRPGIAHLTVFAPDALDQTAARLYEVKDGDEVPDADITVPTRFLHSIGGAVTLGGSPTGEIAVSLRRPDGSGLDSDAISMSDGSYRFDLLPPGAYTLHAKPASWSSLAASRLAGQVSVQLSDTDVLDANIQLALEPTPQK